MDCLTLKNHLLPCVYCVIPLSLSSLPFCIPSAHLSFFLFISFTSLFLSPSVFCDAFTLSLSTVLCPSCPPFQRWTVFLSFHYSLPILASPTHTHSQNPSVILTFFICNSCHLFLLSQVRLLQEQYKSKASGLFHLRLFMELL